MTELNTIVYFPRKISLQNTAGSAGQSLETGAGKPGRIPKKVHIVAHIGAHIGARI